MTILDRENLFSIDQTLVASFGATYIAATDRIDLLGGGYTLSDGNIANVGGVQFGVGQELYFYGLMTADFTSAGAATLRVRLLSDTDETGGMDAGSTEHFDSGLIAVADATDETLLFVHRLSPSQTFLRYLGAAFVIGTADSTGGTIRMGIKTSVDQIPLYDDSHTHQAYS